jgi:hypothetical protein
LIADGLKKFARVAGRERRKIMTLFADLLYNQSMAIFGVPATIAEFESETSVSIVAIDRTSGVEVDDNSIGIKTIRPAADVRRADLDAAGIDLADLDGGSITINGTTWEISSLSEKPTPFGTADGLVTLLLVGNV